MKTSDVTGNARDLAHIPSRTEFIETACQVFIDEQCDDAVKNKQCL
jgi:hypothetical protein